MNKYLFLDIDGVLNSERTVHAYMRLLHAGAIKQKLKESPTPPNPYFDPIAVGLLQRAVKAVDFKIVISSTWRSSLTLEEFHRVFDYYGWDTRGIIVGCTGYEAGIRGVQIKAWLDNRGKFPYEYAIIDDSSDFLDSQLDRCVKTSMDDGLTMDAFRRILVLFGITEQYLDYTLHGDMEYGC